MLRSLFFAEQRFASLDIHASEIRLLHVKKSKKKIVIEAFGIDSLTSDCINDNQITNPTLLTLKIQALVKLTDSKGLPTSIALPKNKVITQTLKVPQPLTLTEWETEIKTHLHHYLPAIGENINYDFNLSSPQEAVLIAAKQKQIQEYRQICQEGGLTVQKVDVDTYALARGQAESPNNLYFGKNINKEDFSKVASKLTTNLGLCLRGFEDV